MRIACPRCRHDVEAPMEAEPTCSECGFSGPVEPPAETRKRESAATKPIWMHCPACAEWIEAAPASQAQCSACEARVQMPKGQIVPPDAWVVVSALSGAASTQATGEAAHSGWAAAGTEPVPSASPGQARTDVFATNRGLQKKRRNIAVTIVGILVLAGVGYAVYDQAISGGSTFHEAPKFILSATHDVLSQAIGPAGARINVADTGTPIDGVSVTVPEGAVDAATDIGIGFTEDAAVPPNARPVSPQVHVSADGVNFGELVQITIPVDAGIDLARVIPVAYDPDTQTWDAAPLVSVAANGFVTVEVARGVIVGLFEFIGEVVETYTGFKVDLNGWAVGNEAQYLSPGGDSLGMTGWSKWAFQETGDPLAKTYDEDVEAIMPTRVQLAAADTWNDRTQPGGLNPDARLGERMVGWLAVTQYPQMLVVGSDGAAQKTVLVTGFTGDAFEVYDPDSPGQTALIPWSRTGGFSSYQGHDEFAATGLAAMPAEQDFKQFHKAAKCGSITGHLRINSPADGSTVSGATTVVRGQVSEQIVDRTDEAVLYVGSSRFTTEVVNGAFAIEVPVDQIGTVDIFVVAGRSPADRQPDSVADRVRVTREAGVAIVATLTWNQADTDVDLYVTEPDGEIVYWDNAKAATKGELDVDDQNGHGPEHYTLDPRQGATLESGTYRFQAHYFEGDGPVSGRLSVTDYTQTPPGRHEISFQIASADADGAGSPGSGGAWSQRISITI